MGDGPELYIFDPADIPGAAEYRAERERRRLEARRRYHEKVVGALAPAGVGDAPAAADAVFAALFDERAADGAPCPCSCHPRLPEGDHYDAGFTCSCQLGEHERRARFGAWKAEMDAYWASPDGQEATAAREAEEAELSVWVEDDDGVVIESHGGMAPELWRGTIDGRSFFFRERHDDWRIELDLRPSGHRVKVWKGGGLDDDASTEWRELDEGDVIAEGTTRAPGYGTTPAHGLADLTRRLGRSPRYCPACGTDLRGT